MTVPPQINATLTAINGPGLSERYNRAAGAGSPKWRGTTGIYIQQDIRSFFSAPGALNRVQVTTLYMDGDLEMTDQLKAGDTVFFTYRGVAQSAKVQDIGGATLDGVPNYLTATLEEINAL